MIGIGLFRLEFEFLWRMDHPSLVIRAPIASLFLDFLGVFFPFLGILILPLLFSFTIMRLFSSLFLTLSLVFPFFLDFIFSGRGGLEALRKFEGVVFQFPNQGGKCKNMFLLWVH